MVTRGVPTDQALGWNLERKDGRLAVYSSGAGTGYTAALIHYPEQRVTVALLVNQNQYKERWDLLEALTEKVLASRDDDGT